MTDKLKKILQDPQIPSKGFHSETETKTMHCQITFDQQIDKDKGEEV